MREKEKQIETNLFDHIVTNGGNYTVLELAEKYVSLKTGIRHNTVAGYKTVINVLKKEANRKKELTNKNIEAHKQGIVRGADYYRKDGKNL